MHLKLLIPAGILFTCLCANGQGFKVQPGTTVKAISSVNIVVQNGNFTNNGNGNFSGGSVYLTGSAAGTIGGTKSIAIKNLVINKPAGTAFLGRNITTSGNIVLQNGQLDLNGDTITLAATGLVVGETETNRIVGPLGGVVSITLTMNAPLGDNPGNLGALIASTQNLGSVTIQRGHKIQQNSGAGKSIARHFNIVPANNAALNAIFRFKYLDAELNGLTESGLQIWKSTNGTTWSNLGSSGRNTTLNFVDLANVNTFARFTLSPAAFSKPALKMLTSETVADNLSSKINSFALTPNPVHEQGKLNITAAATANSMLSVYAADGRLVMQQQANLIKGANQININVRNLASGTYYLVVELKDGTKKSISFLKQ